MTCPRCQSQRHFQFDASKPAADLPLVCRDCGLLTVRGEAVQLPTSLESYAKNLAEQAAQAGQRATQEITADTKIAAYFSNVYRNGYLDGFMRCLAYHRHNTKEGRVKRLREIWKQAAREGTSVRFGTEAFDEFDRLLTMGVDAPSPADADPTQQSRPAHLPGRNGQPRREDGAVQHPVPPV